MTTALAVAGALGFTILSQKYQEYKLQQLSYRMQLQEREVELKKQKAQANTNTLAAKELLDNAKITLEKKKQHVTELKTQIAKAKANEDLALQQQLEADLVVAEKEQVAAQKEYNLARKTYAEEKYKELQIDNQITENMAAQRSTMGLMGGL